MPNNNNMAVHVYIYIVVFLTICGTTSARGRHMLNTRPGPNTGYNFLPAVNVLARASLTGTEHHEHRKWKGHCLGHSIRVNLQHLASKGGNGPVPYNYACLFARHTSRFSMTVEAIMINLNVLPAVLKPLGRLRNCALAYCVIKTCASIPRSSVSSACGRCPQVSE